MDKCPGEYCEAVIVCKSLDLSVGQRVDVS